MGVARKFPMIIQVKHYATFSTGVSQWEAIADKALEKGEKRLAKTITRGVARLRRRGFSSGWISLRFRDGSIQKILTIADELEGTTENVEMPVLFS